MIKSLRQRWRRWVNRRIPRADEQTFTQNNIFILPSGAGVVFGALLVIMLLTGINYQNSLIYLLTFVLGAIFVAAMHQTHRNLAGIQLALVSAGEAYPGSPIVFRLRASAKQQSFSVLLQSDPASPVCVDVGPDGPVEFELTATARRRGPVLLPDIRVETRFPFGLLTAWSWMRLHSPGLCYPKPVTPPYDAGGDDDGDTAPSKKAADPDHADIRPWRQGDLSQRVLWKRYARTGDMVIAEWEGEQGNPVWLDFDAFPGADRELRLSYLAALVEARSHTHQPYGLRLPGLKIDPDAGPVHRQQCLHALGTFGFEIPATRVDSGASGSAQYAGGAA